MSPPEFLDLDEILEIHATQLDEFGGMAGVRDRGLLESAVEQPRRDTQPRAPLHVVRHDPREHVGTRENLIGLPRREFQCFAAASHRFQAGRPGSIPGASTEIAAVFPSSRDFVFPCVPDVPQGCVDLRAGSSAPPHAACIAGSSGRPARNRPAVEPVWVGG